MLLIAGLGNPGASYAGNRHNIGFLAADAIAQRHGFGPWRRKFKSEMAEGELGGTKALILKPQTYMNRSGEAVGEAMRFYKLTPDDLVVLYDELDLAPGKLRVRTGGGAGGHNGIRSIDAHCGNAFKRVRLGIGHPGDKQLVQRHVLGDFAKADREWLDPFIEAISENFPLLARGEDSTFMNHVATATRQAAGPAPDKGKKKKVSHIHQARSAPKPPLPKSGPMAEMFKKLFGSGDR